MSNDIRQSLTKNLNDLIKIKNIKAVDLAEAAGVSKSAVSHWLAGDNSPNIEVLAKICQAYDVRLSEMLNEKIEISYADKELLKKYRSLDQFGQETVNVVIDSELRRCTYKVTEISSIEIPMSEYRASAGTGNWLDEEYNERVKVVDTPQARRANIVIEVAGDSMEPKFHEGDKVLVKIQPDVDLGETGIFLVDGCGYIKQKGEKELISLNTDYPNVPIKEYSDCRCFGKVLGLAELIEE